MSGPETAAAEGGPAGDPDEVAASLDVSARAHLAFPVVGIGASAGGLHPLRTFFAAMPADSGMAFVVVQHLPPEHESLMAEILSRHTSMPVLQIEDGTPVEPNHVYVIRPGFTLTLQGGLLHLGAPVEARGHRRPVDDFFRSLAQELKEKAIAIVLSGMGTNGTAGAQAVKAAGGLCLAQEPESAEFPGMPRSLIYAGYADQVLKPADMPAVLTLYAKHPYVESNEAAKDLELALLRDRQHVNQILAILRTRSKHDFTGYKKATLLRRIQRRMGLLSQYELGEYAEHLRGHDDEVAALANDLMINVTGFFRDPQAWEALRTAVIRPLIEERDNDSTIRAWVTACASGEEAFSMAMLLAEEADHARKRFEVKIFATDTADKSLVLARAGVYPGGIEGDVSSERLERFFDKDEHTYRVKKEIREMVVFAPQDVLRDPPFSKIDICTCRNMLIYLEPEVQRRVLSLLHFSLREGGYLFLGNAETLGAADKSFEIVSKRWRIYRRIGAAQHQLIDVNSVPARPSQGVRTPDTLLSSIQRPSVVPAIQQALLDRFAPPAVVVDRGDRIVYLQGNTTPYLAMPAGEPTHNLFEMLRGPLNASVRHALRRAANEYAEVVVVVRADKVDTLRSEIKLQISVAPLTAARVPEYFCVSFRPAPEDNDAAPLVASEPARLEVQPLTPSELDSELESELRVIRRELQDTVEAFERSNEELKASNEEVISINEELQSANEELETSKEELQSLNEELITVNGQLQAKVSEVEASTNDLTNLLSSTNIAVLFLDTQFRVRRFTPAVTDLLALIESDIGRPIVHLAPKFSDADLVADARTVLATLIPLESEMRSDSGVWYLRRTLPYRTNDDRIAGVVITFVDISARRRAEQSLEASQERLQAVIEQMPTAILLVEAPSGKLAFGNRRLAELFGLIYPLPFVGASWAASVSSLAFRTDGTAYGSEELPLARTLASGESVHDEEIAFRRQDGTTGILLASSTAIYDKAERMIGAVGSFWDITQRKAAAEALRESEERYRLLVESATDYAIFTLDLGGRITSWNSGAERLLGWTEQEALGRDAAMIFTPEDRATGKPEQEMQQATAEGRAVDERPHVRKDGSQFWATGILSAVHDERGKIRGFAKIMRDNTERLEREMKLQRTLRNSESIRAAVESANQAKDNFISTVSHELRTPLNTIRLWSRMLGSGRVPHEEWGEGIQMIDRAARAQQQLIDDLLDVSRMSTGHLRLSMRPIRLSDSVKSAVQAVQPLAEARKVSVDLRLNDAGTGVMRADPDRIQQVIWNLLANSVKFTPIGGRIQVRVERRDDAVEIAVQDNGIGISKDFLPHVFERFQQAEGSTTRRQGGLGLGLAIAKQLIELHGGEISAHSEGEGRGATFVVRLPLNEIIGESAAEEVPQQAEIAQGLRFLRVLLVEDDPATRYATSKLLQMHGANVEAVDCAASARDAYSRRQPAVLVCDVGLPGEDGFTLIQQLRAIESERGLPRVPALALTAFARAEDRQKVLAAGFDVHLAKPANTDELVATLQRLARTQAGEHDGIQQ